MRHNGGQQTGNKTVDAQVLEAGHLWGMVSPAQRADDLGPMWPHLVNFFHSTNRWFFGSLGTTPLGWFVENVVLFAATVVGTLLVLRWLRGKAAMTQHARENVLIGVVVYFVVSIPLWGFLYGRSIIHASYEDHEYFVGKVKDIRTNDTTSSGNLKGSLTAQISTLQKQNSSLKADLDRHRDTIDTSDPVFPNLIYLLQAFQIYRGGRHGEPCVMYFTAPKDSEPLASMMAQFSNSVSGCFTFGPGFELTAGSDEEALAKGGMQPDFIICHIAKDDAVGSALCGNLSNQLLIKTSYKLPEHPEQLYRLDKGQGQEHLIWLQFGTNAQWKSEYYRRNK